MTKARASVRGQPLLLLGLLLVGWACLRINFWQSPLVAGPEAAKSPQATVARGDGPVLPPASLVANGHAIAPVDRGSPGFAQSAPPAAAARLPVPFAPLMPLPGPMPDRAGLAEAGVELPAAPASPPLPVSPRMAAGHNLLMLAGFAHMEVPQVLLAYLQPPPPPAVRPVSVRPAPQQARWSADGWVMLRQDGASPLLTGRPSYGRSQLGAVLRYRLAPASARSPQVQLRVSRALAGARETEAAAGLSIRPVSAVPVRLTAELRVTQTGGGTRVSPAAYAVTELPTVALPLNLRGEAYAQAGYVGGEFATPFADGQARVDRGVVGAGGVQLRAGAGAWGGAQRGSARMDIGPTATLAFRLGDAQARVAADYRFRVAGTAQPSSGPAITLSAGF